MNPGVVFILFLIMLTSACDTVSQLSLKSAINTIQISEKNQFLKVVKFIIAIIMRPRVMIGGLFSLLSLFIWLFALSKSELNYAFSADSMHYIFIAVASRFILKEKFGATRLFGTILIVVGIALISIN